jgi:DNA-binding response OmpR family regulator
VQLKILVVDDVLESRKLLTRFINRMGHHVIEAADGKEAVDIFQSEAPDIVIMDVMMPVMDGYEATRIIKSLANEKWVPVVFCTALDQLDQFLKGLEIGGDDFISKPFNFAIFSAKIKVLERTIELQETILEKRNALKAVNAKSEHEMQLGKDVLDRLIRRVVNQDSVQYWVSPLDLFSGDIVLSAKSPNESLHILHADSAGHGLSAALAIVPAIEIFYEMTRIQV